MVNFPVQRKEVATFENLKTETIHLSTRQSLDGEAYEEHPTSPEHREAMGFNASTFLFRVELMSATRS